MPPRAPRAVPELPEVETVRRHIAASLVGKRLVAVENTLPKLLRDSPIPDLGILVGKTVTAASRRAKVLTIAFDDDLALMIHLKLAGQWAIVLYDGERRIAGHPVPDPTGPYPHKVTHVTFTFDDGTIAYLSDVRQFGWLRLMPMEDVPAALDRFGFGPEGTDELGLSALGPAFLRRGIPVKSLLLDQTFIAGWATSMSTKCCSARRCIRREPPIRSSRRNDGQSSMRFRRSLPKGSARVGRRSSTTARIRSMAFRRCMAGRASPASCVAPRSSRPGWVDAAPISARIASLRLARAGPRRQPPPPLRRLSELLTELADPPGLATGGPSRPGSTRCSWGEMQLPVDPGGKVRPYEGLIGHA